MWCTRTAAAEEAMASATGCWASSHPNASGTRVKMSIRLSGLPPAAGGSPLRRIDIFTLVPDAFGWLLAQHPVADAIASSAAAVRVHHIRDYSTLSHRQVDDTPYGGG